MRVYQERMGTNHVSSTEKGSLLGCASRLDHRDVIQSQGNKWRTRGDSKSICLKKWLIGGFNTPETYIYIYILGIIGDHHPKCTSKTNPHLNHQPIPGPSPASMTKRLEGPQRSPGDTLKWSRSASKASSSERTYGAQTHPETLRGAAAM